MAQSDFTVCKKFTLNSNYEYYFVKSELKDRNTGRFINKLSLNFRSYR